MNSILGFPKQGDFSGAQFVATIPEALLNMQKTAMFEGLAISMLANTLMMMDGVR